MRCFFAVMALLVLASAVGCTHNQTRLDPDAVRQVTDVASGALITNEGNVSASFKGIAPNPTLMDGEGFWDVQPGQNGLMGLVVDGARMFTKSQDVDIEGLELTLPGEDGGPMTIKAARYSLRVSDPMAQQVAGLQEALPNLDSMTKTEAQATVERMHALGQISDSLFSFAMKLISAWPG